MNYYFISSDTQRFLPFQDPLSAQTESYIVDEVEQLSEALPVSNASGVFFIHAYGDLGRVEEFVRGIRKLSTNALVVYVLDPEGIDPNALKGEGLKGDAYVKLSSTPEEIKVILSEIGDEVPPPPIARNIDEEFSDLNTVAYLSDHFLSKEMDEVFRHLVSKTPKKKTIGPAVSATPSSGVGMSDNKNDNESGLSLISDFGDLSLSDGTEEQVDTTEDSGMDLLLPPEGELSLAEGDELSESVSIDDPHSLNLDDAGESLDLSDDLSLDGLGDGDLSDDDGLSLSSDLDESPPKEEGSFKIADNIPAGDGLDLDDADALGLEGDPLDFGSSDLLGDEDLSEEAKEKLREIDELMESTSSQIMVAPDLDEDSDSLLMSDDDDAPVAPLESIEPSNVDEPLVTDDLDLDSLDFSADQKTPEAEKPKKKKKEDKAVREAAVDDVSTRALGAELKEISGAYTVEMERAQATIANLRADREELLNKIQVLEDEKVAHGRQGLTMRAELDEKKIELSIIRKKLNEEISDLKDRLKLHDERRLILEEKNKILSQELEKASHKNKIDLKKVQMRERELEQKLELLKSDAETQIRNRDLKILELKRKIDSMEFDMESISIQEKKSVESRFELEDKLDKAIKTLRNAITVLEDDSDRDSAVQALKKNIDV